MREKFRFMPLKNQQLHEVDLPEYVRTIELLQELHKSPVVKIKKKSAKLVKV